ncbi:MAG TPA: hypothetical protein PKD61_13890 [Polyangiaceae bacterium]|nr:hypothetical protein [Polyangiaceae bacterium]
MPSNAAGSEDLAEQFFTAGSSAYHRGEFRAAAEAFESAHRHAPRAATILNAARAWRAAEEPGRAANAYAAALNLGGLPSEEQQNAQQQLTALSATLGRVQLLGPAGTVVGLGEQQKLAVPTEVYVAPGTYSLTALFPSGQRITRTVRVRIGTQQERLEAPPAEPPQATRASAAPESPALESGSSQSAWGIASLGAAGALTVGAVILGTRALDARDRYDASDRRDIEAYDEAKSLRLWTNVLWGGAVVAGGVGVTLIVTAKASKPRAGLRVGPDGVSWMGRF